jgi:hypothetical protein
MELVFSYYLPKNPGAAYTRANTVLKLTEMRSVIPEIKRANTLRSVHVFHLCTVWEKIAHNITVYT